MNYEIKPKLNCSQTNKNIPIKFTSIRIQLKIRYHRPTKKSSKEKLVGGEISREKTNKKISSSVFQFFTGKGYIRILIKTVSQGMIFDQLHLLNYFHIIIFMKATLLL